MAIGSALVSGVAGLLGTGLSAASQSSTNKTNLQIARENNIANQQLQTSQNNWNLAQWQRENEYNSAASQVQRYRDAGLNPALMMNQNGSAGTASSLQSAPYTPAQSVSMQPLNFSGVGQAANDAIQAYFNARMTAANVRSAEAKASSDEALANNLNKLTPEQVNNTKADTALAQASADKTAAEATVVELFGQKEAIASIEKLEAEKLNLQAQRPLYDKQGNVLDENIKVLASERVKNYAEANNLDVNSARAKALLKYEIANLTSQALLNSAATGKASSETRGQDIDNDQKPVSNYWSTILNMENANSQHAGALGSFSFPALHKFPTYDEYVKSTYHHSKQQLYK